MDYTRLIKFAFVMASLVSLGGCMAEKQAPTPSNFHSFYLSKLPPPSLLILAEQFLEWQKGMGVAVHDEQQGLIVTEWMNDGNPAERYRITIRVLADPRGALLTAHIVNEVMQSHSWRSLPPDLRKEGELVAALEKYVESSPARRAK